MRIKRGRIGFKSLNSALTAVLKTGTAAPVNAVAALLTTALAGANNDMTFTSKVKGIIGHGITIRYVNPGVETATEAVAVVGKAITVTLRSVSTVLSTAAQVKAAVEANAAANALVTVAHAGGNDGSGVVIALAATALAGGVDGTVAPAESLIYYGGYMYYSPTASTTATASWVKSGAYATF